MHNTYPQMGRWSNAMGCYIYDETPQMGSLGGFNLMDALESAVKKVFPDVKNEVVQKFLSSDDGRELSQKLSETAYAVGKEQAIAEAAREIAAREAYWKSKLSALEQDLRENWKKYALWAGIGIVALAGIYFVIKAAREKA